MRESESKTVLVVEDNELNMKLFHDLLEAHGYNILQTKDGMEAHPFETNDNILFHDQNNRDVERIMQRIAENTLAHNAAIDMIRNQFDMLEVAIRERL